MNCRKFTFCVNYSPDSLHFVNSGTSLRFREIEWILRLSQLEPMSAFTSLRFSFVQPHVTDVKRILMADTTHDAGIVKRRDEIGGILRSNPTLHGSHVEGVLENKDSDLAHDDMVKTGGKPLNSINLLHFLGQWLPVPSVPIQLRVPMDQPSLQINNIRICKVHPLPTHKVKKTNLLFCAPRTEVRSGVRRLNERTLRLISPAIVPLIKSFSQKRKIYELN